MPEPQPDIKDLLDSLEKLIAAGALNPQMALDPVTAGFNFGTAVVNLIGKIIDTVPADQHEANYKRLENFLDKLQIRD